MPEASSAQRASGLQPTKGIFVFLLCFCLLHLSVSCLGLRLEYFDSKSPHIYKPVSSKKQEIKNSLPTHHLVLDFFFFLLFIVRGTEIIGFFANYFY